MGIGAGMPPAQEELPPPLQEEPGQTTSDANVKNIKRYRIDFNKARQVVSDFRAKNVIHKEEGNISPNILAAASRGF